MWCNSAKRIRLAVDLVLSVSPEAFAYDADGNQTLVKTATGIWQVTYNGENRPIRWKSNNQTISNPNQTILTMSYDRMGRRVTKNDQCFVYDGYLQVANLHSPTPTQNSNYFIWDPTEPVATRPLVWTATDSCEKCTYKVLLVIKPGKDYHWYRRDDDGLWSHKQGDMSIDIGVVNPEQDARQRGYTTICGYLCFPTKGIDADGTK